MYCFIRLDPVDRSRLDKDVEESETSGNVKTKSDLMY